MKKGDESEAERLQLSTIVLYCHAMEPKEFINKRWSHSRSLAQVARIYEGVIDGALR
jgi:hypothetical protein